MQSARTRESTIERKVCAAAKKAGWLVRKVTCPGHRGFPDRLLVREGYVVLVEFKRPGGKPRANQVHEHRLLMRAGLDVRVIDDAEVGVEMFG